MRVLPLTLALALLAVIAAAPASAAPRLTEIGSFDTPVYVTAPPGDGSRLFVVEKPGRIVEILNGQRMPAPFLDIVSDVTSNGEQGLLSMAFAPDYATSRKFYVYYTAHRPGDSTGSVITVQEFATLPGNPDAVDLGSRRTVYTVDHPGRSNHNGGQLQFGPDGLLYAGTGDGGGANDRGTGRPSNNAQNLASNLGKLLRVDPDTGAAPEIYAYGLRNPWRFSFDRQTGDLTIADVGQNAREEVDFAPAGTPAGTNYGWVCWEGTLKNANAQPTCDPPNDVFPVLEKDRDTGFCAIVGGYVVRDPALSTLAGRYVYGDNCATGIRSAALVAPPGRVSDDSDTGLNVSGLTSFGEDSCGHVYATSGAGPVYRIDDAAFVPCPNGGPAVRIRGKKRQRVVRQRALRLSVSCSQACSATVRGTIRIRGRKRGIALKRVVRNIAAGQRAKVRLKLKAKVRRTVAKALRRKRAVTIRVSANGRNAAAYATTTRRTFRARR
jgi:hypothetical protein